MSCRIFSVEKECAKAGKPDRLKILDERRRGLALRKENRCLVGLPRRKSMHDLLEKLRVQHGIKPRFQFWQGQSVKVLTVDMRKLANEGENGDISNR